MRSLPLSFSTRTWQPAGSHIFLKDIIRHCFNVFDILTFSNATSHAAASGFPKDIVAISLSLLDVRQGGLKHDPI